MYLKQVSHRIFMVATIFFSWLASDALAEKNFSGAYGGAGAGYGYTHGKFNGTSYRGMSLSANGHAGYGWISDKVYYGIEGGAGYDAFSKKKGGTDLKQPWQGSLSLRIGRVLRSYFLPFMRLGVSYDRWGLRSLGRTTHYNTTTLVWGVGVDAFVNDRVSIRSEFDYARSMGMSGTKGISSKKPIKAGIAMGVSYHL
jgi:hypothetical protein